MAVVTAIAVASFVIAAVSTAYQIIQAKKMKRAAEAAAEARRGFELPVEGSSANLSLIYGRAKIGGTRVWHATGSEYKHVTSNADKIFQNGSSARSASVLSFTFWGGNVSQFGQNTVSNGTLNVGALDSGYLSSSQVGTKNEYLFFQQALCVGPIQAIHDVIIDESRYIDDPSLGTWGYSESDEKTRIKAAMRIDCHLSGGVANTIAAANFSDRGTAVFQDMAYASIVVRMDRDDPQFSGVPTLQFLIEGRKVRTVINGVLSTSRVYSNNPAWCLLDYLLDPDVGKNVDVDELDLASFEAAAAVCATVVQTGVTVGGKIYQPTDDARNVSSVNLPLYECNIILDPQKPVRENIESLLSTMGDGRLIWSSGKYRLSLQYPVSNAAIVVDEVITDDDLVMDQDIDISWPTGSERFNYATVRFHNEMENFKEDSVSWPPKITDSYYKGIGGQRYGLPTDSWDEGKSGGRLLNNYGVWDGDSTSVTLNYLFKVDGNKAGSYTVTFTGDDTVNFTIKETKRAGGAADLQVFSGSRSDWEGVSTGTVTLGSAGTTKFYRVTVNATDNNSNPKKNKKGVGIKIENSTSVLWTTRDPTYSDFVLVSYNKVVHDTMFDEDGDLELETEIFAEGITDPYHALAKAEELVRTSRSAFSIKFKYRIKDKYLEPGDFIRLESSTLGLGFSPDYLYIRVASVKIDENAVCEVTGTRFDASQLAWNVKDNVYVTAPSLYESRLNPPSNLIYTGPTDIIADSSGVLSWDTAAGFDVAGYVIYCFNPSSDPLDSKGQPVYTEIGRSTTNSFIIPPINAASAFFGVRSLGINGRLSQMAMLDTTTAQNLEHNWTYGVTISLSDYGFIRQRSNLQVVPTSIVATANAYNFKVPQYKWYVDGVLQASTASTLTIASFTNVRAKFIEAWVNETGSQSVIKAYSSIVYLEEGTDSTLLQVNADRSVITYDSAGSPSPSSQTTTFTASKQNTTSTVKWTAKTTTGTVITPSTLFSGGTVSGSDYTGDQVTMTASAFNTAIGAANGVIVTASLVQNGVTVYAVVSVVKIAQGATGLSAISASLTNPAVAIGTDSNGDNGIFTNSGTVITVKEGDSALDFTTGTVGSGQWSISASGGGIVTVGSVTDTGTTATYGDITAISSDAGKITYTISGKRSNGTAFTTVLEQLFVKVRGAVLDTTNPNPVTWPATPLTYELVTLPSGAVEVRSKLDWNASTSADISYYEVGIRKNGTTTYYITQTSSTEHVWVVDGNTSYDYIVTPVDKNGNKGTSATQTNQLASKDSTVPNGPTPGTSVTSIRTAFLRWTNVADTDLKEVQIFEASVVTGSAAPTIPASPIATVNAAPGKQGGYARAGILSGREYYYWLKSVDTSGNATASASATAIGPLVASLVANTDFTADSISADVLQSNTSLPGSLTITPTGFSLSTINTIATDPAARINVANTTLIAPGKISVVGAGTTGTGTITDWKFGNASSTEINGGVIAADTINANSLNIGVRGIDIAGIQFEVTLNASGVATNVVTWTGGTITYTNDAGSVVSVTIASGTATWSSGTLYLYWVKGATSILSNTATGTAYGADRIVLASYRGSSNLVVNYGRTVINGDSISTNSINGNRLLIGSVTADRIDTKNLTIKDSAGNTIFSAGVNLDWTRIANVSIGNAVIQDLTIGTEKIQDLAITRSSSFEFNFNGFSYATDNTWFDITATVYSPAYYPYVGEGLGDYDLTGYSGYYPVYTYVGAGNGAYSYIPAGTNNYILQTSILTSSTAVSGTQIVNIGATLTIERDGGSDDNVGIRLVRTNDGAILGSYTMLRARSGKSTYSLFFKDTNPISGATNTYKIQAYNNSDNSHYYECAVNAVLYRK